MPNGLTSLDEKDSALGIKTPYVLGLESKSGCPNTLTMSGKSWTGRTGVLGIITQASERDSSIPT